MADERDDTERSEDPTQKRLDDALKRGDVAKSQEVNTWFVIAGATLVLMTSPGGDGTRLTITLGGLIANSYAIPRRVRRPRRGSRIGVEVIAAIAIPLLLLALAAIGGNMIQHRLVWSAEGSNRNCRRFRRPPASSACSPSRRWSISSRASSSSCCSARSSRCCCGPSATAWNGWWRPIMPASCR